MATNRVTKILGILLVSPLIGHYIPVSFSAFGFIFTAKRLSIIILIIISIILVYKEKNIILTRASIGFISLLIFLQFTVLWSIAPEVTARRATDLLLYLVFFVTLVVFLERDGAYPWLINGLVISALLISCYGVLGVVSEGPFRNVISYISRNDYSRDVVALFPIMVVYFMYEEAPKKVLGGMILLIMITTVPMSGSRGGLVSLLVVCLLLVVSYLRYEYRLSYIGIVGLNIVLMGAVAVCMVGLVRVGYVPDRLLSIPLTTDAFSPEVLGIARYQVHRMEFLTIREYWLTGIGYGAFTVVTGEQLEIGSYQAHSLLTRVWLGGGIVAVFLLAYSYLLTIQNYGRQMANTKGKTKWITTACFIGLLGITLAGMVNIVINETLFYILMAIGASGAKIEMYNGT